ncbi:Laminin subunit gamma-3 [Frankliniella fusca]|uniref:Laminin subunit gamma-3 n=1 Tax=Frankliniella fusca TaxID=407009 RepID=A0AAE1LIA5_9NEOP|nr:Laminin subunit gamma-3 [Frankliniella fusca]
MARAAAKISSDTLSSLHELSVELETLGILPLIDPTAGSSEELFEAVLHSAWMLINLVHKSSMGLSNSSQNSSDREALLHSEKLSLQLKLEALKKELASKDDLLSRELMNVYKVQEEKKRLDLKIQKQTHLITQLTNKLKTQEKNLHHEVLRLEAQCEQLRELVRKYNGVGSHQLMVESIHNNMASLSASDISAAYLDILKTTQDRLKSSNSILIGENLMLRDALKLLHHDIHQLLESIKRTDLKEIALEAFRLPLEFTLSGLKELRQEQIQMLYNTLK